MKSFEHFTQQYSLSKTQRFEARPVGQTLAYIEKEGFLRKDERTALEYKKLKKWIDEYHGDFIEKILRNFSFQDTLLQESFQIQQNIAKSLENKKNSSKKKDLDKEKEAEEARKALEKKQETYYEKMRKEVVEAFKKAPEFANLFKSELISGKKKGTPSDLEKWALQRPQDEDIRELIEVTLPYFAKFTSYFTGFHENRKNMYAAEEQDTAISHRIVGVNWPKFCLNRGIWKQHKLSDVQVRKIEQDFAEELEGKSLEEFFALESFNYCLRQDGIDRYNSVLGGKFVEGQADKIQGINEYYNLIYQENGKSGKRIHLTRLYKQILGKESSHSFVLPAFENDRQMVEAIGDYWSNVLSDPTEDLLDNTRKFFMQDFPREGLGNIYLHDGAGLKQLSRALFDGDWGFIYKVMGFYYQQELEELSEQGKKLTKKQEKELEQKAKAAYLSIGNIEEALLAWKAQQEESANFKQIDGACISSYFRSFADKNGKDFVSQIHSSYENLQSYIEEGQKEDTADNFLLQDKHAISHLKEFMDSVMALFHFLKPLSLEERGVKSKDSDGITGDLNFYSDFHRYFRELEEFVPMYNKVRNRVTQKPYSEEKFKLNFENATLLNGWDQNKELDNTCTLLQRDGKYYLGIINPKNVEFKKSWKALSKATEGEDCYQKMVYKLVPGPNKMLPKVFLSEKGKREYSPSEAILENYKKETHKKGSENFCLKDCRMLIDYFKDSIKKHPEWGVFQFEFSDTSSYQDISGFYREFERQSYRIDFVNLSSSSVEKWISEGSLYLFELYNKDFSPKTKGTPNLHTLYWHMLFALENLEHLDQHGFQHPVFKLNGEAEMFYRRKSLDPAEVEHPKGQVLKNKRHQAGERKKTFNYDIIKDRRFKQDKFFFHVPISINYAIDRQVPIDWQIRKLLAEDSSVNIIGIDRGERHLAYYTVVNQEGEILEQGTLNEIKTRLPLATGTDLSGATVVDYHALLDEREKDRDQQQQNWQGQSKIKDLKKGYVSQVVHKICTLMREHNAIVVLEDLNFGFKRGRFKIEKQIYQNLERALIQKLNYLVFKDLRHSPEQSGSILKGLQLCSEFESFRKLGKQSGVLFYVPAAYTSKIDPLTGFSNLFSSNHLNYSNVSNAKEFLTTFRDIVYDAQEKCLRFDFCYNDFSGIKVKDDKLWQVYAKGSRLIYKPQKKVMDEVSLEDLSHKLLPELKTGSVKSAILAQEESRFWKGFLFLFKAALQMRNSCREREVDYIISPVKGAAGQFFDSRTAETGLPQDADANGAYHIALKGLQYIGRIQDAGRSIDGVKKIKLAISNQEWFDFVQAKPYLKDSKA